MVDVAALGEMAGFIQHMPEIMFWAQIAVYIFLVFFFGSIAVKGYKGYMPGIAHLLLRVGTGVAALIAGIGISGFIPVISESPVFSLLQLDLIIGGIIASAVMLSALYIATLRFSRILVVKKEMEGLQRRFERTRDRHPSSYRLDPLIIVGIVIIAVFLVFSLVNFKGFPDMSNDLFSQLGMTPEEFSKMGNLLGGSGGSEGSGIEAFLPDGVVIEGGKPLSQQSADCNSVMLSLASMQSKFQDPEFLMNNTYSDDYIKLMIEGESGKSVSQMFLISEGKKEAVIAVTADMFTCVATLSELCTCMGTAS